MKVFTSTSYREHDARNLVEYLDKEHGLQDRTGEQMSEEDIEAFIEESEEFEFERQIIISPQNGDRITDREFSHYTRRVMSEYCTDRQTATYCFAIHRDTDHPHTQVALTGTKRDLWMDKADCVELRERAHEHFIDNHRELTRQVTEQLETTLRNVLPRELLDDHTVKSDGGQEVEQTDARNRHPDRLNDETHEVERTPVESAFENSSRLDDDGEPTAEQDLSQSPGASPPGGQE